MNIMGYEWYEWYSGWQREIHIAWFNGGFGKPVERQKTRQDPQGSHSWLEEPSGFNPISQIPRLSSKFSMRKSLGEFHIFDKFWFLRLKSPPKAVCHYLNHPFHLFNHHVHRSIFGTADATPATPARRAFEDACLVAEILRVAQKGRQTLHRARLTWASTETLRRDFAGIMGDEGITRRTQ